MTEIIGDERDPVDAIVDRTDFPLYVVTAAAGTERAGCVAGFVSQCSIRPPRFIVCISPLNHTFQVAVRADGMAMHLLGRRQGELARLFGERTGDIEDKFERCTWQPGTTGAPILTECAAWTEGTIGERLNAGDHEAFVLHPTRGGPGPHEGVLTLMHAPDLRPGHPIPS